VIKFVGDFRQIGGFLRVPPVSSTNKTDRHDITEILLKVALSNIEPTNPLFLDNIWGNVLSSLCVRLRRCCQLPVPFCQHTGLNGNKLSRNVSNCGLHFKKWAPLCTVTLTLA
jgi:hypothetical protein